MEQKSQVGVAGRLDLSQSVWQLTEEHPELVEVLASIGFLGVRSALIRGTVGRKMTIPEGCRRQGIELAEVRRVLAEHCFATVGGE